jgi:hypothetical protein
MRPNTLQQILMNTYRGGQFAHLKRGEDLRTCGDEIFIGLYNTLDDSVILDAKRRGIDPALLATQRLNGVLSEIGHVIAYVGAGVQLVSPQVLADLPA